ncbi:MAG: hypothetical protein QW594_04725, partial [Candidatus Woesearchaeota archaeon]
LFTGNNAYAPLAKMQLSIFFEEQQARDDDHTRQEAFVSARENPKKQYRLEEAINNTRKSKEKNTSKAKNLYYHDEQAKGTLTLLFEMYLTYAQRAYGLSVEEKYFQTLSTVLEKTFLGETIKKESIRTVLLETITTTSQSSENQLPSWLNQYLFGFTQIEENKSIKEQVKFTEKE